MLDVLSTIPQQTRHTVTAIIVAHDGARLLPGLVQALQAQTYPVERVVGVDTGSRDRSGAVLAELIVFPLTEFANATAGPNGPAVFFDKRQI